MLNDEPFDAGQRIGVRLPAMCFSDDKISDGAAGDALGSGAPADRMVVSSAALGVRDLTISESLRVRVYTCPRASSIVWDHRLDCAAGGAAARGLRATRRAARA